jgi:hypothetical protein
MNTILGTLLEVRKTKTRRAVFSKVDWLGIRDGQ